MSKERKLSRRGFLRKAGAAALGLALSACVPGRASKEPVEVVEVGEPTETPEPTAEPTEELLTPTAGIKEEKTIVFETPTPETPRLATEVSRAKELISPISHDLGIELTSIGFPDNPVRIAMIKDKTGEWALEQYRVGQETVSFGLITDPDSEYTKGIAVFRYSEDASKISSVKAMKFFKRGNDLLGLETNQEIGMRIKNAWKENGINPEATIELSIKGKEGLAPLMFGRQEVSEIGLVEASFQGETRELEVKALDQSKVAPGLASLIPFTPEVLPTATSPALKPTETPEPTPTIEPTPTKEVEKPAWVPDVSNTMIEYDPKTKTAKYYDLETREYIVSAVQKEDVPGEYEFHEYADEIRAPKDVYQTHPELFIREDGPKILPFDISKTKVRMLRLKRFRQADNKAFGLEVFFAPDAFPVELYWPYSIEGQASGGGHNIALFVNGDKNYVSIYRLGKVKYDKKGIPTDMKDFKAGEDLVGSGKWCTIRTPLARIESGWITLLGRGEAKYSAILNRMDWDTFSGTNGKIRY